MLGLTGLPLFLLVSLILSLLLLWWSGRRYRALFKTAHLTEIAEGLDRIKGEAIASIGRDTEPEEGLPPGSLVTRAGYGIFYSIERADEGFGHHISYSYRGAGFAVTAAGFLAAFLQELLGVEAATPNLAVSRKGRYHMAWKLDADAHRRYAQVEVEVPVEAAMAEITRRCWKRGREIRQGIRTLESLGLE